MSITQIRKLAQSIHYHFSQTENDLFELVTSSYYKHTVDIFSDLFKSRHPKSYYIERFESILSDNWALVKGTTLCYTSTFKDDVTYLMVKIAEYLAQQRPESKSAFEYLMPGVAYENTRDGYPELDKMNLMEALRTHILGDAGNYLIPVKILLELDFDPSQNGLNNPYYHEQLHNGQPWKISAAEMQRLFSHSKYTRSIKAAKEVVDDYSSQDHLLAQLRLLCKNLRLGSVLMNGTEMDASDEAYQTMINFMAYFDKLYARRLITKPALPENCEEWIGHVLWIGRNNLYEVNAQGQPIQLTIQNIEIFRKRLKALKEQNPMHKADMLLTVLEWDRLCQDIMDYCPIDKRISPALRNEILYLFRITTQHELNLESHENTESCSMKRREILAALVLSQEELLAQIHLESEQVPEQLQRNFALAQQTFKDEVQVFSEHIQASNYSGYDNLEHYAKLVRGLDIDFEIIDVYSLGFIEELSVSEIQEFYQEFPDFIPQTLILFRDVNDLVFYLLPLSSEKRIALLSIFKLQLGERLITTLDDFLSLVKVFDADSCGQIIRELYPYFFSQIDDIRFVQMELEPGHFRLACANLKPFIRTHLNIMDYCELVKDLNRPGYLQIFQDVALEEILDLVKNPRDYRRIKSNITPANDQAFFESLFHKMNEYVQSADDFEQYLRCLNVHQKNRVFENFLEQYPQWIQNIADLQNVLRNLHKSLTEDFYLRFTPIFNMHLSTLDHYAGLLKNLPDWQSELLAGLCEDTLHQLILDNPTHLVFIEREGLTQHLTTLKPFTLSIASEGSIKQAKHLTHHVIHGSEDEIRNTLFAMMTQRPKQRFFSSGLTPERVFMSISSLPNPWKAKIFQSFHLPEDVDLVVFKSSLTGYEDRGPSRKKSKKDAYISNHY